MNTAHSTPHASSSAAVKPGSTRSTVAPAAARRSAAAVTAAAISASTAQQPRSTDSARRMPAMSASSGRGQVERTRHRHDVGVVGPLGGGEEQPGVVGAAGQRAVVGDRVEQSRQHIHRDPAQAGLEPDHAAPGGRDAHGSAHVAALGQGDAAGGDGRRAPAGRAAGRAAEIVGVAGHPPQRAVGLQRVGELRSRGLADDHGAGATQRGDDRCVAIGHEVLEGVGARRRSVAGDGRRVLHRDRHPVQHAERRRRGRSPARRGRRRASLRRPRSR